jgi:hypothetical protein
MLGGGVPASIGPEPMDGRKPVERGRAVGVFEVA